MGDANLHGVWGLVITWNDGHATGIYPFETLRRWSEGEGQQAFGPDSGWAGRPADAPAGVLADLDQAGVGVDGTAPTGVELEVQVRCAGRGVPAGDPRSR